jgi:hypothetical protein
MNAQSKKITPSVESALDELQPQLAKLRAPFPDNQISKLPKETKKQAEDRKADQARGNWPTKCAVCEGFHHPNAVHLDYVGHAAATDRLLDVDLEWNWEPFAVDERGLPAFDQNGGLWIRLTVCGVTRIGYGCADGKSGGDAKKEIIGDAIRNAGMRFGMALDLWHKGQLHADDEERQPAPKADPIPRNDPQFITEAQRDQIALVAEAAGVPIERICNRVGIDNLLQLHADMFDGVIGKLRKQAEERAKQPADIIDDDIPY